MKVISLYQPYASLVVSGAKQFETRSWDTNYRGPLLIHATKAMPTWCKDFLLSQIVSTELFKADVDMDNLPMGQIIGKVNLVATHRTDVWMANRLKNEFTIQDEWVNEFHFGDYSGGRFAWELKNAVRFARPIPARGSQGFWNFDLDTLPALL